ncbi:MAG: hypothetical protein KDE27_18410 [Planctomycetes bacterium]|nr:hypothetical protein [Planctomycetota bacterium]
MRWKVLASLAAASSLSAQIIVSGGGLALANAVATAADGAVISVLPGTYEGFDVSGKGLTILGSPGVFVTNHIAISGLASQQHFTLRELIWPSVQIPTSIVLDVRGYGGGTILLDRLTIPADPSCVSTPLSSVCWRHHGLYANNCRLVVRNTVIGSGMFLQGCETVIDTSVISGEDGMPWAGGVLGGRSAITAIGGSLQIGGSSTVQGGNGWPTQVPGAGIRPEYCDIRVLSGTVAAGGGGIYQPPDIWFWPGGGTVRVTARAVVGSASLPILVAPMPELLGASAPVGGVLSASVVGEAGDAVFLLTGLPANPTAIPGLTDALWLDANAVALNAAGTQPAGSTFTGTLTVPGSMAFLGLRLAWQAVAIGPVTGVQASNPVVTLVH